MAVLLRPWLPSMLFSLNQRYIQSELCVQKNKKGNTCKGACFMKKSLQAQQERDQELPGLLYEQLELAQMQPSCSLGVIVAVAPSLWTWASDERVGDQFLSDLPVPPPWIADRLS